MRLNSEDLRELYQRETTRSARGSMSGCLTEELLARAAAGELSQLDRERTADHLVTCSDCAKELRAIRSIKSWADEESIEVDARTIPFLISENGKNDPNLKAAHVGTRRVSFYLPYAVAAAALIMSFVLGALLISKSRENERLAAEANNQQPKQDTTTAEALVESRRQLEETTRRVEQESAGRRAAEEELAKRDAEKKSSSRAQQSSVRGQRVSPDINVPIIDLNPGDAGRGDQNQKAATIQLSPDTDLFTLILNLSREDSSGSYSLEVVDRNNRIVWTGQNLRKSPYNNFTVAMRKSTFPAGEYRLKIFGVRNGKRELIEEYAIRLTYG